MSIRKRGTKYQVRVAPFPAKTFDRKRDAEYQEAEYKRRKRLGDLWVAPAVTLGSEADRFLERKRTTANLRAATTRSYELQRKFWQPLDGRMISSLRRGEIEDLVTTRARQHPRSAKNELMFLKAVLRAAEARGQRFDLGILSICPVRHEERRGIALTNAQLVEFQSHAPEYIRRMIWLAGTTAMRWGALVLMEDSWLDLDHRTVHIPAIEGCKSKRDISVPLTGSETQLFRKQLVARAPGTHLVFPRLHGTAWTIHSHFRKTVWLPTLEKAQKAWRKAHGTAETPFDGFHFHDLRHTASSLMGAAGMNPTVAAARRGDSDGGITFMRRYRHLYPGEAVAAMPEFERFLNPPKVNERWSQEGQS